MLKVLLNFFQKIAGVGRAHGLLRQKSILKGFGSGFAIEKHSRYKTIYTEFILSLVIFPIRILNKKGLSPLQPNCFKGRKPAVPP